MWVATLAHKDGFVMKVDIRTRLVQGAGPPPKIMVE
jgi:hypothetical protein